MRWAWVSVWSVPGDRVFALPQFPTGSVCPRKCYYVYLQQYRANRDSNPEPCGWDARSSPLSSPPPWGSPQGAATPGRGLRGGRLFGSCLGSCQYSCGHTSEGDSGSSAPCHAESPFRKGTGSPLIPLSCSLAQAPYRLLTCPSHQSARPSCASRCVSSTSADGCFSRAPLLPAAWASARRPPGPVDPSFTWDWSRSWVFALHRLGGMAVAGPRALPLVSALHLGF